jgi:hypothetical protein
MNEEQEALQRCQYRQLLFSSAFVLDNSYFGQLLFSSTSVLVNSCFRQLPFWTTLVFVNFRFRQLLFWSTLVLEFLQLIFVREVQAERSYRSITVFNSPSVCSFFSRTKRYNRKPIVFPSHRIDTRNYFIVI